MRQRPACRLPCSSPCAAWSRGWKTISPRLCEQTYPAYQLVFGVRDPHDPAIAVVAAPQGPLSRAGHPAGRRSAAARQQLQGQQPDQHGGAARHPWLVLADSDIAVRARLPGESVARRWPIRRVGIVTCLYRGRSLDAFWTRLGALFIDTWFAPSVRVASAFGGSAFGFGATIALRADTLAAIGGFEALRNRLADDFWLGPTDPRARPGNSPVRRVGDDRRDGKRFRLAVVARAALDADHPRDQPAWAMPSPS